MTYEKKDGDVSLFANEKEGNDKRPDYKGTALISGVEYEVALWNRVSQKGTAFLSDSIKPATAKKEQPKKEEEKPALEGVPSFDDEIPWG
jgi:uncharacterized protein (DUF736 family)